MKIPDIKMELRIIDGKSFKPLYEFSGDLDFSIFDVLEHKFEGKKKGRGKKRR